MAAPWECATCGATHPLGCRGHVDECSKKACRWRTGNHVGTPCSKCGSEVKLRPCRSAPRTGGTHCRSHGGSAKQVLSATERRVAQAKAGTAAGELAELLEAYDTPTTLMDDMVEGVRLLGLKAKALHFLAGELQLEPKVRVDVEYGERGAEYTTWANENAALWGADHSGDAKPHVLVEMARVWTVDWLKACKLALDAGIDQRRLELDQGQARQIAGVIRGLADALLALVVELAGDRREAIEAAWREQLPVIARAQLEAITTTEVPA